MIYNKLSIQNGVFRVPAHNLYINRQTCVCLSVRGLFLETGHRTTMTYSGNVGLEYFYYHPSYEIKRLFSVLGIEHRQRRGFSSLVPCAIGCYTKLYVA